jgi:hypothetical protein
MTGKLMTGKRQDGLAKRRWAYLVAAALWFSAAGMAQSYKLNGQPNGAIVDYFLTNSGVNGDTPYCVQTAATYASGGSAGTTTLNRNDGAGNVTISGKVLCLINDAAFSGTGGNALMISLDVLDMATPSNTRTSLVNAFSSYGPGVDFNTPSGWHGKGGSASTQGDNSWKTDPPFAVPGGWVCVPIFRQSQTGFTGHDLTLTCSPDGGHHWCNPNTYYHRAGGAGCDTTNWDANGDAPKCGAASSSVACTDSGYNDATHSSMMWHEPAPYDSSAGFTQQLYFFTFNQGNDGTLPFGNYLYAFGSPGNRGPTALMRMANTIGAVLDPAQWTAYSQTNYSPTNVGSGTSWVSNPQTAATALWADSSVSGYVPLIQFGQVRGSPSRICAGSACTLLFQGVWANTTTFGYQLISAPAPWGPYTVTTKQVRAGGNGAPNFWNLMQWTQKTINTSPFHVQVISLWDNTIHHPAGTLYWQPVELTVASPGMGVTPVGNVPIEFSMASSAHSLPRKGLQYFFDFYEPQGDSTYVYSVTTYDQAKVLNGAYQQTSTAALELCYGGSSGCGYANGANGWTGYGISMADNLTSIGLQLRDISGGAGNALNPAMFAGDAAWTVTGVSMFDSTSAGDNHHLFSAGAAPNNIGVIEIAGFLWVQWFSGGSGNSWLINGASQSWHANAWHSWTITKSPGVPNNVNTHLYLDGVETPAATSPQGSPSGWPKVSAGPVSFGKNLTSNGVAWQGGFGNAGIWNRALSAPEVLHVYQVQKAMMAQRGIALP